MPGMAFILIPKKAQKDKKLDAMRLQCHSAKPITKGATDLIPGRHTLEQAYGEGQYANSQQPLEGHRLGQDHAREQSTSQA